MNTPTYQQQFDKITEAYIRDEIKPLSKLFCFCGTLSNDWMKGDKNYSYKEYADMEEALFSTIPEIEYMGKGTLSTSKFAASIGLLDFLDEPEKQIPNYEDKLFSGMVAALEVLKQIHIERGEVIDTPPQFIQRTFKPDTLLSLTP